MSWNSHNRPGTIVCVYVGGDKYWDSLACQWVNCAYVWNLYASINVFKIYLQQVSTILLELLQALFISIKSFSESWIYLRQLVD